ncbi:MAG: hypothetical protein GXX90_07100 [Microbacteriaceae bacterium]|nr:hypothetical protein [Microbacteriaceae bacterium]
MTATIDDVRAARARAAASHAAALGGASACAISKSGGSHPAGKFWEGQTAALGELQRSGADDLAAEARRLEAEWRARHVPGGEREAEAYRAGGLEALQPFAHPGAPA